MSMLSGRKFKRMSDLKRGIPPHIDEDNTVTGREVKAGTSRLEGDENDARLWVVLDPVQRDFPLRRLHLSIDCSASQCETRRARHGTYSGPIEFPAE